MNSVDDAVVPHASHDFGDAPNLGFLALVLIEQDARGVVAAVDLGLADQPLVSREGIEAVAQLAFEWVFTGFVVVGILPEGVQTGG